MVERDTKTAAGVSKGKLKKIFLEKSHFRPADYSDARNKKGKGPSLNKRRNGARIGLEKKERELRSLTKNHRTNIAPGEGVETKSHERTSM